MADDGSQPVLYQYVEGGGDNPPFGEDPFQRIVNVHWRVGGNGGVFASGSGNIYSSTENTSHIYYAKMPTKDSPQTWQNLGSFDFLSGEITSGIFASSYAKINGTPTFLLGGNNASNQGEGWSGIIMLSNDGLNWTNVLTVWEVDSNNTDVSNLVWDVSEQAFYADVYVAASTVDDYGYRLYRSPDGHTWTRMDIGTTPVFSRDAFLSHCNGKIPGFPDGVYGYDKVNDILMTTGDANDTVKITLSDGSTHEVSTGLSNVIAVAYAGGIWIAGGTVGDAITTTMLSAIASSTDNGETWSVEFTGLVELEGVLTVIAAPIEDFNPPS